MFPRRRFELRHLWKALPQPRLAGAPSEGSRRRHHVPDVWKSLQQGGQTANPPAVCTQTESGRDRRDSAHPTTVLLHAAGSGFHPGTEIGTIVPTQYPLPAAVAESGFHTGAETNAIVTTSWRRSIGTADSGSHWGTQIDAIVRL